MSEALGIHSDVETTTHAGHAVNIARNATKSGYGLVVCLSGDGVLHEVVLGLLSSGNKMLCALAVIPCGSCNGISKSLYDTVEPFEAAAKILNGERREANLIGVGMHSEQQW